MKNSRIFSVLCDIRLLHLFLATLWQRIVIEGINAFGCCTSSFSETGKVLSTSLRSIFSNLFRLLLCRHRMNIENQTVGVGSTDQDLWWHPRSVSWPAPSFRIWVSLYLFNHSLRGTVPLLVTAPHLLELRSPHARPFQTNWKLRIYMAILWGIFLNPSSADFLRRQTIFLWEIMWTAANRVSRPFACC